MAKKSVLERLAEEDLRDYQATAPAVITGSAIATKAVHIGIGH